MESKKEIYDLIPPQYYPKTILVSPNENLEVILKKIKTALFPDIQIKTQLRIQNKAFSPILLSKINYDKFSALKFFKPRVGHWRYPNSLSSTVQTSLSLLDIRGEILLKSLSMGLGSSVGRAKDWKSLCRQFKPVSKQNKTLVW